MKDNDYVYYASHIVHDDFGDEIVIINLHSGVYFSLVDTGRFIWNLLNNTPTIGQLAENVGKVYSGHDHDIQKETRRFLNELESDGLILISDKTPDSGTNPPANDVVDSQSGKKKDFKPPVLKKYTDQQELLLLDPIHEVDDIGWPQKKR